MECCSFGENCIWIINSTKKIIWSACVLSQPPPLLRMGRPFFNPTKERNFKMNEKLKMNPKIRKVEVGVRTLQTVKIYPLSFRDQEELTTIIFDVLAEIFKEEEAVSSESLEQADTPVSNMELIKRVLKAITENMATILEYVTDPDIKIDGKDIIGVLSNDQMFEIADIIFEVNYADFLKNFKALATKAGEIWKPKVSAQKE